MKLLLSAQTYPTKNVQLTSFLSVLAKELVKQDVEVTVIAPQSIMTSLKHKYPLCPQIYDDIVITDKGEKKIKVIRPYTITFGRGVFYKLSIKIERFVINRFLNRIKIKPDIIYSHFWWSLENVIDFAKKNNIPSFVATGEDKILIQKYVSQSRIDFYRKNTKGIICVSSKNEKECAERRLSDNNTIVLPNAVDISEFYKMDKREARDFLGFPQDAFIIAFCGRFNERKGSKRVSDAIRQLSDKSIKSIFIGSSIDSKKDEPDCEGILFKGKLPHNEIPLYLNAADVFILPSLAEGCSNAIVEAMACGLPIISSALPFNDDICNETNSILVNPNNITEITEAIVTLKDPLKREELSKGALKTASHLTISERTKKILNFINENK